MRYRSDHFFVSVLTLADMEEGDRNEIALDAVACSMQLRTASRKSTV